MRMLSSLVYVTSDGSFIFAGVISGGLLCQPSAAKILTYKNMLRFLRLGFLAFLASDACKRGVISGGLLCQLLISLGIILNGNKKGG